MKTTIRFDVKYLKKNNKCKNNLLISKKTHLARFDYLFFFVEFNSFVVRSRTFDQQIFYKLIFSFNFFSILTASNNKILSFIPNKIEYN